MIFEFLLFEQIAKNVEKQIKLICLYVKVKKQTNMKREDLPQDKKIIKGEDHTLRKIFYVTNNTGNYESAGSDGWEVENMATRQAWEDMQEKIEAARQRVINGEASPIEYYMYKSLMDVNILAGYIGKWRWIVKRHLKPSVFNKLKKKTLERYAAVFNITVEDLTNFPRPNNS